MAIDEQLGKVFYVLELKDKTFNKEIDKSKKTVAAFDKQVTSSQRNLKQQFNAIGNSAKLFGDKTAGAAEKQTLLKNKINDLLKKGVDPQNKGVQKLFKQYKTLDEQTKKNTKSTSLFSKALIAGGAIALTKVFIGGIKKSIKAASDLEEATQKFNVVFKEVPEAARLASEELVNTYKASTRESRELLGATGDLLAGFGFSGAAALDLSSQVQRLSFDLASFSNFSGGASGASEILTKALLGERDALVSLGIKISEEDLKARLFEKGLSKLTGTALRQARAQETLAIAQEQSGNAIGDLVRSSGSYANVSRAVQSRIEDLSAKLGSSLLPVLSETGQALLGVTEDGSVLSNFFNSIVDDIGVAIKEFNKLIKIFDLVGKKFDESTAADKLTKLNKEQEILNNTVEEGFKDLADFNTAVVAGEKQAVAINKRLKEITEERIDALDEANGIRKKSDQLEADILGTVKDVGAEETKNEKKKEERQKKQAAATKEQRKQFAKLVADFKNFQATINQLGETETEKIERTAKERNDRIDGFLKKGIIGEKEAAALRIKVNKEANDKIVKLSEEASAKITQQRIDQVLFATNAAAGIAQQIGELLAMSSQNDIATIENEKQTKLDAIAETYDTEKAAIEALPITEAEKNAQLSDLDMKRSRDELAIEESQDKKIRKIQLEAAERQKAIAIATTAFEIPAAAFSAFKSAQVLPFPASAIVGGILATAATAFGLAKIALIKQQPLPKLADGGLFQGPAIIGEAGPELAVPLSGPQGRAAIDEFARALSQQISLPGTPTGPGATTDSVGAVNNFAITFNVAAKTFFTEITQGIENRDIVINLDNLSRVS